jgi:hypothetical protein
VIGHAEVPSRLLRAIRRKRTRDELLSLFAFAVSAMSLMLSMYEAWGSVGLAMGADLLLVAGLLVKIGGALRKRPVSLERIKRALAGFSVQSLTGLAALLAGSRRRMLRHEWDAHLGGESGHDPVTWRKIRQAFGFVAAAIQLRLADAADLAWRPADAVLGSRALSNLFVGGPVIVVLFAIVDHDGRFGLVADVQDPAALGAFLYGVVRTGRWWRGVKPPAPKARRARE